LSCSLVSEFALLFCHVCHVGHPCLRPPRRCFRRCDSDTAIRSVQWQTPSGRWRVHANSELPCLLGGT
jgi:hypothetical protein